MDKVIRIIVADDNRNFCRILQDYLQDQENFYIVGVAHDGLMAWELIQDHEPDLVLVDLVMPSLDGLGVMERINSQKTMVRPKVIMQTAFGQRSLPQQALEVGVDYFILKPFDLAILCRIVRRLTENLQPESEFQWGSSGSVKVNSLRELVNEVTTLMHQIGVPAHLKGHQYIREAILMAVQDVSVLGTVNKDLYPVIAKKYNTAARRVERGIHNAIESAWERGKPDAIQQAFGHTINTRFEIPKNAEFIKILADIFRETDAPE